MAKTDTLKSIATIAEIGGDIYTKNKALDLALLQIQASRQDSQYAQEMEQKRFDFTKNQAEVANSLNQLKFAQDNRNYIAESEYIVPDGVGVRFKTFGYPSSSYGAGSYNTLHQEHGHPLV